MQLATVVSVSLHRQVADAIRDAITECRVEEGGRLIERELSEMLGVGRSTVREALRQLEAEGLVDMASRSPHVTVLSREDARQMYALRAILEPEAAAAAARRATPAEADDLRRHYEAMCAAFEDNDFPAQQAAKTQFYRTLFEAGRNRYLAEMARHLRARMSLVRGLDIDRRNRMEESIIGAREILQEVRSGKAVAARAAARRHVARATRLALAAMALKEKQHPRPNGA